MTKLNLTTLHKTPETPKTPILKPQNPDPLPHPPLRHTGRSGLFHPRRSVSEGGTSQNLHFDEVIREWRTIPPWEASRQETVVEDGGRVRRRDRFKRRARAFIERLRSVIVGRKRETVGPLRRVKTWHGEGFRSEMGVYGFGG